MEEFWFLILVAFFATNSLDKAESVELFDEIFGEGWWDKDKADEWYKLTLEQNVLHQIDRQNTQIGQIEPNSTDQNPPPDNVKNSEEQNEISSNEKRKIIDKFHAMKDEFKQKGKYSKKEWDQIEKKICKDLNVYRSKIYKWKKEFGLSRKMHNYGKKKNDQKKLVEKFNQMKAELTRDGFKNSYKEINGTVAKELSLSFTTICNWKRELGQTTPKQKHSNSEQKELMKLYYEIKDKNSKISDEDIAKMLKIDARTLYRWKKLFKLNQFHPNSVDGHSVEENSTANVQEIGNSNSGSI